MSISIPVYFVDAFTARCFSGNNAAIVILSNDEWRSESIDQWMQKVAAELNQPTTAFICHINQSITHTLTPHSTGLSHLTSSTTDVNINDINTKYLIRWFTPVAEFMPCGHATLAASFVLYTTMKVPINHSINFYSNTSNNPSIDQSKPILTARISHDSPLTEEQQLRMMALPGPPNVPMIEIEFIADPPTQLTRHDKSFPMIEQMVKQCLNLSTNQSSSQSNNRSIKSIWTSSKDIIIVLNSVAAVIDLKPRIDVIAQFVSHGLCVTARNNQSADQSIDQSINPSTDQPLKVDGIVPHFVSRMFIPSIGVNEDAVTGSLHRALAPLWADQIGLETINNTNQKSTEQSISQLDNQSENQSTDQSINQSIVGGLELVGYQASARGGVVRMKLVADRIRIRGQARLVMTGQLNTPIQ